MECSWARTRLTVAQLGTGTNNSFPKRLRERYARPQKYADSCDHTRNHVQNRLTYWSTVVRLSLVGFIISLRYCFLSGTHIEKFKNFLSVRLTGPRSAIISDPILWRVLAHFLYQKDCFLLRYLQLDVQN